MLKLLIPPGKRPSVLNPEVAWHNVKKENGEVKGVTQSEILHSIEREYMERGI